MHHPYLLGSWFFLLGCLAFTTDALLGIADGGLGWRSVTYLAGCVLFTVGSTLFVTDAHRARVEARRPGTTTGDSG